MNGPVSTIIPSYNGRALLEEHLPGVVREITGRCPGCEIIVVDNGSSDGSAGWVRAHVPGVTLIELPHNAGFGPACNAGARVSRHPFLLFLNNDVRIEDDFLTPSLRYFAADDVFAVYPAMYVPGRDRTEGRKRRLFAFDMYKGASERTEDFSGRPGYAIYPAGACFFVRRDFFMKLGGFHDLYAPCYWEDIDLGYRAWKRGWKTVYAPEGRVVHLEGVTSMGVSGRPENRYTSVRNKLVFVWSTYNDPAFLARHVWMLCLRVFEAVFARKTVFLGGLREALKQWDGIMRKRKDDRKHWIHSDRWILRMLDQPVNRP